MTVEPKFSATGQRSIGAEESPAVAPHAFAYSFRPIWDCKMNVILIYLCQPITGETEAAAYKFCSVKDNEEENALLDRRVLLHCAGHMQELHRNGQRLLLGVPLHFSTLAHSRTWNLFNDAFRGITQKVLRDMVFIVHDLGEVPDIRLVQELPKLAGSRHVLCTIERSKLNEVRSAGSIIHALGFELAENEPDEIKLNGQIKSMASSVIKTGYEPFLLAVANTSCALHAMAAGVRYLEGPVIHPMVADPHCAKTHKLEHLYPQHRAVSGK
jgi:hypothetical protein